MKQFEFTRIGICLLVEVNHHPGTANKRANRPTTNVKVAIEALRLANVI